MIKFLKGLWGKRTRSELEEDELVKISEQSIWHVDNKETMRNKIFDQIEAKLPYDTECGDLAIKLDVDCYTIYHTCQGSLSKVSWGDMGEIHYKLNALPYPFTAKILPFPAKSKK